MNITKEQISKGYDEIYERIGQSEDFYDRCISIIKNTNNLDVLDIGCGRGFLLKKIKEKYPNTRLFGIDISQKLCEISRDNNPDANIFLGDAESLPFSDNKFDLIFMTETLEHLLDYNKALSEVSRVLKPNGYFVVTVPNRDWLRYDFYNKNREKFQPVDDHYFTFNEISGLIKNNKFKIDRLIGSDNLYYYEPIHKYERLLAFFLPFLHKKMKRLIFRCINSK